MTKHKLVHIYSELFANYLRLFVLYRFMLINGRLSRYSTGVSCFSHYTKKEDHVAPRRLLINPGFLVLPMQDHGDLKVASTIRYEKIPGGGDF